MINKFLFSLLFCLILALPAHATPTPAPDPVPGKGKTSSPQGPKEQVLVIRTAKDPKVNQIKVGEKGEILIPQSTAIAGAAIAGAAAGGGAASPGPGAADAGALKGAEAGDDAKSGGDSNKAEGSGGFKGASGSSGSGDSKTSGLSSGSSGSMGNDSGLLGGGAPSGFSSLPDTTPFVSPFTAANPFSTTTTSSTSSTSTTLLQILESMVSDDGIPGAIMAVQTPTETWIGAAGKADLGDVTGTPQAMTADTQVHLAGVTRLFTAALIMKLVEENKINLDETVDQWLFSGAVNSGDKITVRMLLNHTSGLHDHETTQEFFTGLITLPTIAWDPFVDILPIMELPSSTPYFTPGTDFKSSSSDYYLLGLAAEATSAFTDTVKNMLQTDFFGPLNLTHTALPEPSAQFTPSDPFARSYCFVGDSQFPGVTDTTDWDLSFDWTNGSGVSTAQDILTFTQDLFGGKVVNRDSLVKMTTPQAPATTQGFGFEVVASDPWFGEKAYRIDGETPGAFTRWLYYPDSGRTIFIAFNRGDKRFNTDPPIAPPPDPPQVDASQKADELLNSASTLIKASQ